MYSASWPVFNGGDTTLAKKWVFFISGKKKLIVPWWSLVHSEDGISGSKWRRGWVPKLLPSTCITKSSSYFRTLRALNVADQFLKSPQSLRNVPASKHTQQVRYDSLADLFHINLFWCKLTMNEWFAWHEKISILWNHISLFLWAIFILPLLNAGCCLLEVETALSGQHLLLTLD